MTARTVRVLSLGGGTQSSALALMAARGEVGPMPDVAIFADTGAEPPGVYETVDWLARSLPFPVETVSAGDLESDLRAGVNSTGQRFAPIPVFHRGVDGGGPGMSRRQCTREYKIAPIERRARALAGAGRGERLPAGAEVEQWIGLSWDEIHRCRANTRHGFETRWPLIELRLKRADVIDWWDRNAPASAPPLSRSACYFCPLHSAAGWASLQRAHPDLIERAAGLEAGLVFAPGGTRPGDDRPVYLHRRRVPLRDALALDAAETDAQLSLFDDEGCDGGACFL